MILKSEIRTVIYQGHKIEYILTRKDVKNINLRIKSDNKVNVSAGKRVSISNIDEFVTSKGKFILNAFESFSKRKSVTPPPILYQNGEAIRLFGNRLYLDVISSTDEEIKIDGELLHLKVKNKEDFIHKESLVNKWLLLQYQEVIAELVKSVYEKFSEYNVPYPQIKLRKMTSRWGSCHPAKGIVTLNKELVHEPLSCIEYVIIHEFCHFIHPDHSKRFYDLLQQILPDWKSRKAMLEKHRLSP